MIGRLNGKLLEKRPPFLLLDVNGVGYEIQASMNTFYHLPDVGETVALYTHLVVREDDLSLYGFLHQQERLLFRSLIKVNGVGPKLAITILSSADPDSFVHSVMSHDVESLVRVPGIGKKTAERLIIEMKDRLSDWKGRSVSVGAETTTLDSHQNDAVQDAISALIALGYKPQEASRAISKVAEEGLSREELIKRALKKI